MCISKSRQNLNVHKARSKAIYFTVQTEEQGGIGQLRKKYMRLVKVALAVQNYLGDFAEVLERLHSLITWADPRATLIFLFACILAALATVTLTLPVVMSVGLCWTVSHLHAILETCLQFLLQYGQAWCGDAAFRHRWASVQQMEITWDPDCLA